ELSERVDEILAELADVVFAPRGGLGAAVEMVDVAARVVHVAELAVGLGAGGVGREAGGGEGGRALFYMKAEFVVDVGADVARGAPREREEAAFHVALCRVGVGSSTA